MEIFNINDIIRCESESNYTVFYFKNNKKVMVSKTLKEYESMLGEQGFFRIHQSHLINLAYISKCLKSENLTVIMEDKSVIPVSRNKRDEFLKLISQ